MQSISSTFNDALPFIPDGRACFEFKYILEFRYFTQHFYIVYLLLLWQVLKKSTYTTYSIFMLIQLYQSFMYVINKVEHIFAYHGYAMSDVSAHSTYRNENDCLKIKGLDLVIQSTYVRIRFSLRLLYF